VGENAGVLYYDHGTGWLDLSTLIADNSITTAKLVNDAVNGDKLAGSSVVASHLGLQSVGSLGISHDLSSIETVSTSGGGAYIETDASFVDVIGATSRIKAVVAGLYQFSFHASLNGGYNQSLKITYWKNGAYAGVVGAHPPFASGSAYSPEWFCSRTVILDLAANDYIQMGGVVTAGTPTLTGVVDAVYLGPAS
ncbi:MAG: hypothetical protein Q7R41_11760, partial [Phycisphaerales bacterium]|nr:hypothetical protein [Phycisphaerales bacterium]